MNADEKRARERQDGNYEPEVLAEPVGGPIPPPQPLDEDDEAKRKKGKS